MMNIDPTLSLPRTLQMHAGSQVELSTRCMASAGMPLRLGEITNLVVNVVSPRAQDTHDMQALEVGGFPVMAICLQAGQVGLASVDITWLKPWEDPASTDGFRHRIEVQVHPVGASLPIMAHQVADQLSVAPPASKAEVATFLDGVDGRRPYGARKVATVQLILDQVARSLAMHQAQACTRQVPSPSVADLVPDRALLLLMEMGFERLRLPRALEVFIKGRRTV